MKAKLLVVAVLLILLVIILFQNTQEVVFRIRPLPLRILSRMVSKMSPSFSWKETT